MATLNVKNFPDDLHQRLRQLAAREDRRIAQQVTYLLEQAAAAAEPRSILELSGLGAELWERLDSAGHVAAERDSWD